MYTADSYFDTVANQVRYYTRNLKTGQIGRKVYQTREEADDAAARANRKQPSVKRELLTEDSTTSAQREAEEEKIMSAILTDFGYTHIYGGGTSRKGHGYWMQKNGETAKNWTCHRYGNQNECFWCFAALKDKFAIEWDKRNA